MIALLRVQSQLRRIVATRRVTELRRNTRATLIQSVLRMLPRRKKFKLQRDKAVIVQVFRGFRCDVM